MIDKTKALEAILIPPQLDFLCKEFDLRPEDLEPNFEGWTKHVIMAPSMVFLFPRHPRFDEWLTKELEIYRAFKGLPGVPVPKLLRVVDDEKMSYFRFGVVSRLEGVPFSSMEPEVGIPEYETLLRNLGRSMAIWHQVPLEVVPQVVGPLRPEDHGNLAEECRWILQALSPAAMDETLDSIIQLMEGVIDERGNDEHRSLLSGETRGKWKAVLDELAGLGPVLVHGDIASEQIFVHSKDDLAIAGILDWSTASLANPIFDFNFWEWGYDIWRFRGSFQRLRRAMWEAYLKDRGITLSTLEGLHLFYILLEVYWVTRNKEPLVEENRPLEDEIRGILDDLERVTLSI